MDNAPLPLGIVTAWERNSRGHGHNIRRTFSFKKSNPVKIIVKQGT